MNWKTWLHGLASAVIGGVATSLTLVIVDPLVFNFDDGGVRLLKVTVASGIVNAAFYLKQSPLPSVDK